MDFCSSYLQRRGIDVNKCKLGSSLIAEKYLSRVELHFSHRYCHSTEVVHSQHDILNVFVTVWRKKGGHCGFMCLKLQPNHYLG